MKLKNELLTIDISALLVALTLCMLTMVGCVSFRDLKSSMDPELQLQAVIAHLAYASTFYYLRLGHWPDGINDLLLLPSTNQMDSDSQRRYANITNSISWSDLKDGVAFKVLPNGSLRISIPEANSSSTNHTITGIVGVPDS